MHEIYKTSDLVHEILKNDEKARNSDNYLYYKVLQTIGKQNNVDIEKMSVPNFLLNMKGYKFPGFETVRRSRQKIQHDYSELTGSCTVEGQRKLNEDVFRDYARKVGVSNDSD